MVLRCHHCTETADQIAQKVHTLVRSISVRLKYILGSKERFQTKFSVKAILIGHILLTQPDEQQWALTSARIKEKTYIADSSDQIGSEVTNYVRPSADGRHFSDNHLQPDAAAHGIISCSTYKSCGSDLAGEPDHCAAIFLTLNDIFAEVLRHVFDIIVLDLLHELFNTEITVSASSAVTNLCRGASKIKYVDAAAGHNPQHLSCAYTLMYSDKITVQSKLFSPSIDIFLNILVDVKVQTIHQRTANPPLLSIKLSESQSLSSA